MDKDMICKNCRYWAEWINPERRNRYLVTVGDCQRRAPITNETSDTVFPTTQVSEQCGEFVYRLEDNDTDIAMKTKNGKLRYKLDKSEKKVKELQAKIIRLEKGKSNG